VIGPVPTAPVVAVACLLGLAVGSFLNVAVYRVPRGESVSYPASHCPTCSTPLKRRHNVPVLSWLLLRGRCAFCHAPIAVRYPLVEALTGALFGAIAAGYWICAVLAVVAGLWLLAVIVLRRAATR
jgi:leader peptidase (prepilin peptidase)/N-methyltransferase